MWGRLWIGNYSEFPQRLLWGLQQKWQQTLQQVQAWQVGLAAWDTFNIHPVLTHRTLYLLVPTSSWNVIVYIPLQYHCQFLLKYLLGNTSIWNLGSSVTLLQRPCLVIWRWKNILHTSKTPWHFCLRFYARLDMVGKIFMSQTMRNTSATQQYPPDLDSGSGVLL